MSVCHICLDEMRTNLCTTNPCGHVFHRECLARWERQSGRTANASAMKCPSCNTDTEGVIHIFADFGSDVSSKPQSSCSPSNDLTNMCVMLDEEISKLNEEQNNLQAMVDDDMRDWLELNEEQNNLQAMVDDDMRDWLELDEEQNNLQAIEAKESKLTISFSFSFHIVRKLHEKSI